jgi:hypothetical protein
MRTAIVNYRGIELECDFEFDPPEARDSDHPGFPAEAHLDSCRHKGEDITEMLTGSQIDEIEVKLAEEMEERMGV